MATGTEATRRKLFTPASANAALPYVRAVVADIVDVHSRVERLRQARRRVPGRRVPPGEADGDSVRAMTAAEGELRKLVAELERAGVELKRADIGLVDFPAEMDGTAALLCWKAGEARVAYWHTLSGGFEGRRPLPGEDTAPTDAAAPAPTGAPAPSSGPAAPEGLAGPGGPAGPADPDGPRRPIRRRTP
jgi:hypothetical protein